MGSTQKISNRIKRNHFDLFLAQILLFFLPLAYLPGFGSYNAPRYFFFSATTLWLFGLCVFNFLKEDKIRRTEYVDTFKNWRVYGLLFYLLAFLVVSITSIDPAVSFFSTFYRTDGFLSILFLSMFSFSVYFLIKKYKNKGLESLLSASVLGSLVLSFLIWLKIPNIGGTFGNSSIAASFLIWNVFFALFLFIKYRMEWKAWIWGISFFVLVFSPLFFNWEIIFRGEYAQITSLLGEARGAAMGIIAGLLLAIFTWLAFQSDKIRRYLGIGLTILLLVSTLFGGILLIKNSSPVHQAFAEMGGKARFSFWNSAWLGFKEQPVLGTGPGTFSYSFHKFFDTEILTKENNFEAIVDRSHNIFFETIISGGLLLLFGLLFFLISIATSIYQMRLRSEVSNIGSAIFLGALFCWLLQAQLVFDSISSLTMLFLVSGMAYAGSYDNKNNIHTNEFSSTRKSVVISKSDKFVYAIVIILLSIIFILGIFLPFRKNRIMYRTNDMFLPERAYSWVKLEGTSSMGDSYDSVLLFNRLAKSYANRNDLRKLDEAKKKVLGQELDNVIHHLYYLSVRHNDFDLILLNIQFHYLRMYLVNDFSGPLLSEIKELILQAQALSPTDPRPEIYNPR
ncbi:MAG: O-antigen ligase family protein [Patescibacteria group bacterium]